MMKGKNPQKPGNRNVFFAIADPGLCSLANLGWNPGVMIYWFFHQ